MVRRCRNYGFSLAEVLIAVGLLAVGLIFIAGVFPVSIYFTTVATERTIAAAAADEAFAKIKLYAVGNPDNTFGDDDINFGRLKNDELEPNDVNGFTEIFPAADEIDLREFTYPSTDTELSKKKYFWWALCRRIDDDPNRLLQVTVFVSRRSNPNLKYHWPVGEDNWPIPVKVGVSTFAGDDEIVINNPDKITFINDDYTIVDDETGQIYRVLERYADDPDIVLLDKSWAGSGSIDAEVWVVPSATSGGRYPCIGVFQKVIRF